jgi:hypothetical protein
MDLINQRIAVNTITDIDELGFEPVEYSRFKYGDHEVAKRFGRSLFAYFVSEMLNKKIAENSHLIFYSSPYTYLPTSSFHMTKEFYRLLCEHLKRNPNLSLNLEFGKIERCQTYSEDYGSMSAEERYDLIKKDTYKFNNTPSEKAVLIFIDDISITGTHQKVIEKLLNENDIRNNSFFYYFAKLENKSVDPTFENELNYAYVKGVEELAEILLLKDFRNTTRTTKCILQLNEQKLFDLIERMNKFNGRDILAEIYKGALMNNYSAMDSYKRNLDILAKEINKKAISN